MRAILKNTAEYEERSHLSMQNFLNLLERSFSTAPMPFDESWRQKFQEETSAREAKCIKEVHLILVQQIVDLNDMEQDGISSDPYASLGVDSPNGNRWYNFDTISYLSCAAAGFFGLEPEDPKLNSNVKSKPEDKQGWLSDTMSWDSIIEFFWLGQIYE